ncbi:MAG: hypothetical protein ACI3ZD_09240 [Prevotella sp.]
MMSYLKKTYKSVMVAFFAALTLLSVTSCDEHDAIDNGIHIGYILCSDHSTMSVDEYLAQDRLTAVAVVFAEATEDHPTLAVMLEDNPALQYTDSLGMDLGASSSQTAYNGFQNTSNMQNAYDPKTFHGSPLADYVYRSHKYGQSDYIPSVAEIRKLVVSVSAVNKVIERIGGTPISTEGKNGWYWTSTSVEANPQSQAWLCSMSTGGIQETPQDEYHVSRGIVALNY